MKDVLEKIIRGEDLSRDESRQVFTRVMSGAVEPAQLGGMLCALTTKGECVDELVGAAEAMRAAATAVTCTRACMCTCGTGGDGINTFNVSTTAAIIASAAGAVVAKHGNRTNTRVSGSAEVLAELGVNIDADVKVLEACLAKLDLAFLYAPRLHPAMRHAAPVRKSIGVRTIFNLLGPLCNPAGSTHQVLGVSRPGHLELMARTLAQLGAERAWIVHGHDGLCDLTVTGPTRVVAVAEGRFDERVIHPADAGLAIAPLSELLVGSASESAAAVRSILSGERGPRRDHALLNAGAALVVFGVVSGLADGVKQAAQSVDSGAAAAKLDGLIELTNQA